MLPLLFLLRHGRMDYASANVETESDTYRGRLQVSGAKKSDQGKRTSLCERSFDQDDRRWRALWRQTSSASSGRGGKLCLRVGAPTGPLKPIGRLVLCLVFLIDKVRVSLLGVLFAPSRLDGG